MPSKITLEKNYDSTFNNLNHGVTNEHLNLLKTYVYFFSKPMSCKEFV